MNIIKIKTLNTKDYITVGLPSWHVCVCVCEFVKSAAGKMHGGKSLLIQSRPDMSIFLFFPEFLFIFFFVGKIAAADTSKWCAVQ